MDFLMVLPLAAFCCWINNKNRTNFEICGDISSLWLTHSIFLPGGCKTVQDRQDEGQNTRS